LKADTQFTVQQKLKAESTCVVGDTMRWFTSPQRVTHPSSNRAWRRATLMITTPTRYY